MSKELLVLIDYEVDVLETFREIASEYQLVSEFEEADFSKVEIVLGWDERLVDVLESGQHQLKWIQLSTAGVDKLPLDLLAQEGVRLTSASGMHTHSLAESIFGMLLARTRGILQSVEASEASHWAQEEIEPIVLFDKSVTIIGAGKIGTEVAHMAKAFGMQTTGVNRSGGQIDGFDKVYTNDNLAEAVAEADVVINILPLTPETTGLFNLSLFKQFKPGAMFVNVGRGESVVTADLLTALDQELLSFAALDVFEEEPLPAESPVYTHSKILVTPHIAGFMDDYLGTLRPIIEENLRAFIDREELPVSEVDLERKY
ncbi:NAD(P)-dependent oxidoreductase [Dolosigranulum pigrum]|uniref:NAD(P)-dependent oxidoreductase n=1 Tax=Dolosigranulum pigrum TaxID=29394 RepID=UPI001AD86445|nr:NAD(P)-dependent oxidoreductase [Dolosigranulum pigrum]